MYLSEQHTNEHNPCSKKTIVSVYIYMCVLIKRLFTLSNVKKRRRHRDRKTASQSLKGQTAVEFF